MSEHEHPCSEKVYGSSGNWGHSYPCTRTATVERNKKRYCWQHDPERIGREEVKRQEKYEAECEQEGASRRRAAAIAEYHEAVGELLADLDARVAMKAPLAPRMAHHRDRLANIHKRAEGEPEEGGTE
ncbi:hypothetical protein LCGC14_2924370 [marine sediment metagenome]|uniref:Uncharacterized protein n=1 Tax=marine sediment metagenome TaxID=412755 RepID=A0A0F8XN73_9ZZZZ